MSTDPGQVMGQDRGKGDIWIRDLREDNVRKNHRRNSERPIGRAQKGPNVSRSHSNVGRMPDNRQDGTDGNGPRTYHTGQQTYDSSGSEQFGRHGQPKGAWWQERSGTESGVLSPESAGPVVGGLPPNQLGRPGQSWTGPEWAGPVGGDDVPWAGGPEDWTQPEDHIEISAAGPVRNFTQQDINEGRILKELQKFDHVNSRNYS